MELQQAIDLGRQAIVLSLMISAPLLGAALLVGIIVGTLQAVTQVQDHTLSFVPKIIAVLAAAIVAGAWMAEKLLEFAREMFGTVP